MNPKSLLLALLISISPPLFAADPMAPAQWYQITVAIGAQKETFTGSSRFDATELGSKIIVGNAPITLENLRDSGFFVDANKFEWRALPTITSVHILPRSIVCFAHLPADPLLTQNSAQPAEAKK